jgi:hypothetical protein
MQLRAGLRAWWIDVEKVRTERRGIGRLFGFALCILRLATPTEWVHLLLGTKERPLYSFTDAYVVGVLTVSAIIYLFPSVLLAGISTYFSATTLVVLLNIVLLEWAYVHAPLVICFSNALSRRSKIAPSCSNLLNRDTARMRTQHPGCEIILEGKYIVRWGGVYHTCPTDLSTQTQDPR